MFNQIAIAAVGRLNMAPLAISERHVGAMQSELRSFLQADPEKMKAQFADLKENLCMAYGLGAARTDKPFAFSNGMAVIPIHGMLLNRFGGSWGFVTGYNFIRSQTLAAKADPDVKGVIYDVNSGGGEVAGCQETADVIASLRGVKPSMAVVDSSSYSAAYWTASAADKIFVTPSGGAGSIGALQMHVDVSKALENEGVQVTLLHAGAHKVEGNPYEALSDTAKASMQAGLDEARNDFASSVAANRGLTLEAVLATEARCYSAKEAKDLGLVDGIANPQAAASTLFDEPGADETTLAAHITEEPPMTTANQNVPVPAAPAAPVEPAAPAAADISAAKQEASQAERNRIAAIIGSDEAKGREALANHFAFATSMDANSALEALKVAPAAQAPAAPVNQEPTNPFANAMNSSDNPNIPAGQDSSAPAAEQSQATVDSFFAARELATGIKAK